MAEKCSGFKFIDPKHQADISGTAIQVCINIYGQLIPESLSLFYTIMNFEHRIFKLKNLFFSELN